MSSIEVFTGRPEDAQGRSERELRCYDLLDSLGIAYLRADHPPADTMELCLKRSEILGTRISKNLLLCNRSQTVFFLLLMPYDKQFKTSVVSRQLGVSRLQFAPGEKMEELLDTRPGSLSVLGLSYDSDRRVGLVIDRELLDQELFSCHPCENTASLRFETRQLFDRLLPALGREPVFVTL
jgi:Ala-tRNA(Pro) deacylase